MSVIRTVLCVVIYFMFTCHGKYIGKWLDGTDDNKHYSMMTMNNGEKYIASPLPFPPCKTTDVKCIRRGFLTFLFLMDEGYLGMSPIDPTYVESVSVSYPEIGMRFIMRNLNITGARWTDFIDRRVNNPAKFMNSAAFSNDFHIHSRLLVQIPLRSDFYYTRIVIDIRDVMSNVTYPWQIWDNEDGDDFVSIGEEFVTVAKPRRITFFLESGIEEPLLRNALENRPSILENLATEITTAVVQKIFNNFRIFAYNVPLKFYFKA